MADTQRMQEAKRLYLDGGASASDIARKFIVSAETVRQWLKKLQVPRRSRSEQHTKYQHRSDAFSKNTPDTAYYAGLLMADGNVQPKDGLLQISLQKKDDYLLKSLRTFIGHTGPLFTFTRTHKSGKIVKSTALRVIAHDLLPQPLGE
jgi:transposase-like protein